MLVKLLAISISLSSIVSTNAQLYSIVSNVKSDIASATSAIGAKATEASDGIPGFGTLPRPDEIKKKLNISDEQLAQVPISNLVFPGYANYTEQGWNLRFYGQAYKQPPLSNMQVDKAAELFVPGLNQANFTAAQLAQSRNTTAALMGFPQERISMVFNLTLNGTFLQTVKYPTLTDGRGEFQGFVPLDASRLLPGNNSGYIQPVGVYTNDTMLGNATAYLVPPTGTTFVSDIDDILRITQIYQPKQGLDNSFAFPYVQFSNMPDIFDSWRREIPAAHFHYLTTTPEPVTRQYESFIFSKYPGGSFDTRPYNFTTVDQIFQVRLVALRKIFQTFPDRRMVLIADTSNRDVMRDYPKMAKDFPRNKVCILLRNTTATDASDLFPYDTSGFKGLSNDSFMFFRTSDDLIGLDIGNGGCVNKSVPQNVTFKLQGVSALVANITGKSTGSSLRSDGLINLLPLLSLALLFFFL